MSKPENPPAFPGTNPQLRPCEEGKGMTLRDYFAGQALANIADMHRGRAFDPKGTSDAAYEIADAMLEARQKGGAA